MTKNLSEYNPAQMPDKKIIEQQEYAIVVSDWNSDITYALLDGAVASLQENGVKQQNITVIHVPGAFELTYAAASLQQADFAAIIAIGCVIRGGTPHFDYICQGVVLGISMLNTNRTTPVICSILTTDTHDQALERAGGKHGNKGIEGAITAIKMGNLTGKKLFVAT